ncbi:hypothetical protein F4778DRAFT_412256 [Xylariomycetidae sp. FL2044]|nr:hypothetical protein F4778DRAFT_412256 [Xylariomycetidae sp. FL2044]
MVHFLFSLTFLLLPLGSVVTQDDNPTDPDNHFIYPPSAGPKFTTDPLVFESNLNVTVGVLQSQPFRWRSRLTDMQIVLIQEGNPLVIQRHALTDCEDGTVPPSEFYWDGNIDPIDLKNGSQALLAVYNCSAFSLGPAFASHYINLVEAKSSTTTTSTTTPTTSTAPATTASASSLAASSSTLTSTTSGALTTKEATSAPVSPSTTSAAAIGGGIGGGIGGALVLSAVGLALWRCHSRTRKPEEPPSWHPAAMDHAGYMEYKPPEDLYFPPRALLTRA